MYRIVQDLAVYKPFQGYEIFPRETINSLCRSKYCPARHKPEKIYALGNVNIPSKNNIICLKRHKSICFGKRKSLQLTR